MADPDELARAASDAVDAWCTANPGPAWQFTMPTDVPFTPRTEPVEVTYTTDLDTARARKWTLQLLQKLEREAEHADENVQQWGPGDNQQVRIWQQEADGKWAYAAALRVVLGLPPRHFGADDDQ